MSPVERYRDSAAFRMALESRLRQSSLTKGEAWRTRQRKFIVFDRLLARLLVVAPDRWILKGAVALDFRLGERARATIDLDLFRHENEAAAMADLEAAQILDLGDYFTFDITRTSKLDELVDGHAVRYRVTANLDDRRFEHVTLDVGFDQQIVSAPDILTGSDFFAFAGIPPIVVPTLPLEQHVAEKLHAYTRIYSDGRQSSRVKDLVDLVLIAENSSIQAQSLKTAIDITFASRAGHAIPSELPAPPENWLTPYRALATETGLEPDITKGHALAARLLDPILGQETAVNAVWTPSASVWQES